MPAAKTVLGPPHRTRIARPPHRGLPVMSKMRISRSTRTFLPAAFGTRVAPLASVPLPTGAALPPVPAPCPACTPACVRSSRSMRLGTCSCSALPAPSFIAAPPPASPLPSSTLRIPGLRRCAAMLATSAQAPRSPAPALAKSSHPPSALALQAPLQHSNRRAAEPPSAPAGAKIPSVTGVKRPLGGRHGQLLHYAYILFRGRPK